MAFKKAKGQSHRGDEQKNGTESRQSFSADEPVREVEAATVVLEVVEELSEEELEDRQRLEIRVERSFFESGLALRELRNRRLYRDTHRKFEDYCRDRFDFTYRQANYLIAASNVVENLQTGTNCSHILPTKESQCRSLVTLEPDEQRQLWQEAVERSGNKVPTARVIKGIVERLKEKPVLQLSITYKRGDAFTLQGLTGAERRYNRCWVIAREVLEFGCGQNQLVEISNLIAGEAGVAGEERVTTRLSVCTISRKLPLLPLLQKELRPYQPLMTTPVAQSTAVPAIDEP